MPCVYGLANTAPDVLIRHLLFVGKRRSDIVIVTDVLKEKYKNKILIFLSSFKFDRNIEKLNKFENTTCFVFASYLKLLAYKGISFLDFKLVENANNVEVELSEISVIPLMDGATIVKQKKNFLDTLINNVKAYSSLLRPLMTYLYSFPSSTHQKPMRVALCHWLYWSGNEKDLLEILEILDANISLSQKHKDKLKAMLLSDQGLKYKKAFFRYRTDKDIDVIAIDNEISPFEMRYIKSMVDKFSEINSEYMDKIVNRMKTRKNVKY